MAGKADRLLELKTKLALGEISSDEFDRLSQEAMSMEHSEDGPAPLQPTVTAEIPIPEIESLDVEPEPAPDLESPNTDVIEIDNGATVERSGQKADETTQRTYQNDDRNNEENYRIEITESSGEPSLIDDPFRFSDNKEGLKAGANRSPLLWIVIGAAAVVLGIFILKPDGDREKTPKPVSSPDKTVGSVSSPMEPEMVRISGGTFRMGSESEPAFPDEKPIHEVTLSSYWLGKYEVTQAEWEAVMGSNPSYFNGNGRLPVENVSWNEVKRYIQLLNSRSGKNYRLPTEAEWEFACRGGWPGERYGDVDEISWNTQNSGQHTQPVGLKRSNGFGLFDMLGNVWEWCEDRYGSYGPDPATNPRGADSGFKRALRGGSCFSEAIYLRASNRGDIGDPSLAQKYIGFRLARD